jgi:hypothetical protein
MYYFYLILLIVIGCGSEIPGPSPSDFKGENGFHLMLDIGGSTETSNQKIPLSVAFLPLKVVQGGDVLFAGLVSNGDEIEVKLTGNEPIHAQAYAVVSLDDKLDARNAFCAGFTSDAVPGLYLTKAESTFAPSENGKLVFGGYSPLTWSKSRHITTEFYYKLTDTKEIFGDVKAMLSAEAKQKQVFLKEKDALWSEELLGIKHKAICDNVPTTTTSGSLQETLSLEQAGYLEIQVPELPWHNKPKHNLSLKESITSGLKTPDISYPLNLMERLELSKEKYFNYLKILEASRQNKENQLEDTTEGQVGKTVTQETDATGGQATSGNDGVEPVETTKKSIPEGYYEYPSPETPMSDFIDEYISAPNIYIKDASSGIRTAYDIFLDHAELREALASYQNTEEILFNNESLYTWYKDTTGVYAYAYLLWSLFLKEGSLLVPSTILCFQHHETNSQISPCAQEGGAYLYPEIERRSRMNILILNERREIIHHESIQAPTER